MVDFNVNKNIKKNIVPIIIKYIIFSLFKLKIKST